MNTLPRYAVITGASAGIGAAFAKELASRGFSLMLAARREDRLEELADSLPVSCDIVVADLSTVRGVNILLEELKDKEVGLFINGAGFGLCGSFAETPLNREVRMIHTNVEAVHRLTKAMIEKMERAGGGCILNIASAAGLLPAGPYMATYYATKAYVASLSQAVAEELRLAGSPVYVGCLCPGPVDTEFNDVADVEFALPGISAEYCVRAALAGIAKRETVIVPSLPVRAGTTLVRFLPRSLAVRITGGQQARKKGAS